MKSPPKLIKSVLTVVERILFILLVAGMWLFSVGGSYRNAKLVMGGFCVTLALLRLSSRIPIPEAHGAFQPPWWIFALFALLRGTGRRFAAHAQMPMGLVFKVAPKSCQRIARIIVQKCNSMPEIEFKLVNGGGTSLWRHSTARLS